MSDEPERETNPFEYKAPVPPIVRRILGAAGLLSLLVIMLVGLGFLDLPQWLAQSILLVLVVSLLGIWGIKAADWWAWRRSEAYVPGLRKQQRDKYMQASPFWRSFSKVGKVFGTVSGALTVGLTVLFLIALVSILVLEITLLTGA